MATTTEKKHDTTTTTAAEIDGGALLEELLAQAHANGQDTRALDKNQRRAVLVELARKLGLNPLSNAVMFLLTNGRETLYVTKQGTDQIAAREKLRRETIKGPEVVQIENRKVVFCQVRATHPDGRSEVSTATLALQDVVNDLMKCESKAKRRATLSVCGLGLLAEDEIEAIPGAQRADVVTAPTASATPPAYPAWQAFAADLETVTDIKSARACWEMHNAALQREADAEHQRGGELVVDKLTALGYEMTAAHGRAAIGGTLDAHLIEVYEGLVRVGRREGDDDFALAVADVVAVLRAHRDAPESVRKDAAAAGSRTLQSLGMTAADARAALTAALKPPPPPDGTNAPAAGTRGATTARGEGRTTAADTTAPAASEVRVERDDDPDGERARAFAWLTHIAACKSPEHVAGSLRKRAQEFRAQGVFAARRAAVVDEMARRLDGDRVRAEALLCGVLAGIREAA